MWPIKFDLILNPTYCLQSSGSTGKFKFYIHFYIMSCLLGRQAKDSQSESTYYATVLSVAANKPTKLLLRKGSLLSVFFTESILCAVSSSRLLCCTGCCMGGAKLLFLRRNHVYHKLLVCYVCWLQTSISQ